MLSRCEPRCRLYTELCNRSSSSDIGSAAVVMPHNLNTFEDYWEDASVSLGSCHGWEMPMNPCSTSVRRNDEDKVRKTMEDINESYQIRPSDKACLASQMNEYMACLKPRSFPPPMASCVTLSIKEGGRFVLKEMNARPQGFLRAERENGRLRLHLIQPDDEEDEGEDGEGVDGGCDERELAPIDLEDNLCDQAKQQSEHEDPDEEGIRSNGNDGVEMGETLDLDEGMCRRPVCGVEHTEAGCSTPEDCDAESADMDCEKRLMKHIAANSSSDRSMQVDVFGPQQQESLWSNDAVADLNPWSPKQMFLHQSLARMSPALGLAMS